jgi:hypothetical protein
MILPPPPYRLSPAFARRQLKHVVVFFLLGAGLPATWLFFFAMPEAKHLIAERKAWDQGETAVETKVQGRQKTRQLIFHEYDLDVEFVAVDGARHHGRMEFDTFLVTVSSEAKPHVRYLPSDPTQFALSWGREAWAYRWATVAVFSVGSLAATIGFFSLLHGAFDELWLAYTCSSGAHEIELVVVDKPSVKTVRHKLEGQSPWGGAIRDICDTQPVLGGPLFLDETETYVLALVSPSQPRRALVVRDTLLPYEFSETEIESIRRAVDARRAVARLTGGAATC